MKTLEELYQDGNALPGGCGVCEAFQTVDRVAGFVYVVHVHHDDWCPVMRMMKAGEN